MKIVSISQPRFLPHITYLRKIKLSDIFIMSVDLNINWEFVERRNKIKLHNGKDKWLTMPVTKDLISKSEIRDLNFADKLRRIVRSEYKKKKFFSEVILKEILFDPIQSNYLHYVQKQIRRIMKLLDIDTEIKYSNNFNITESGQKRLEQILAQVGEDLIYISGMSGVDYIKNFKYQVLFFNNDILNIPYYCILDTIFKQGVMETRRLVNGRQ